MNISEKNTDLVRPKITCDQARQIVFELYGVRVHTISELNGYDDKNFHVLVNLEHYYNKSINKVSDCGYVLKVVNSRDSENDQWFEAQTQLLFHLDKNNIRCPQPILTKNQQPFEKIQLESGEHIVRLLEYISGDIIFKIQATSMLFFEVGVLTAKMDNALKVGIIHGDINEQNLITEQVNDQINLRAVIDFGDAHYSCYLYELAIAMTYMIFTSNDVDSGGFVLAGYASIRNVPEPELKLLRICILTRFCQSLVLGAHASLQEPDNEYILTTAKKGWTLLESLDKMEESALLDRWISTGDHVKTGL